MLLVFALALLGAWAVVGAAEGVLGLLALLADVGLVEDKDPGAAVARFVVQEQVGDGSHQADEQGGGGLGQACRTEEGLDLGERVGEDHGGTPSATEDRLGYPSL